MSDEQRTWVLEAGGRIFANRTEAGQILGDALSRLELRRPVVVGIPRGGLAVAREIAIQLRCDLDFLLPKKLGAPGNPEYAIGAITERGTIVLNDEAIQWLNISDEYVQAEAMRKLQEIKQRADQYRRKLPSLPFEGRDVILTDDGVATGSTMKAAIRATRAESPYRIILALPVVPFESFEELAALADVTVAVSAPEQFRGGVGAYYLDFGQVTDGQAIALLEEFHRQQE